MQAQTLATILCDASDDRWGEVKLRKAATFADPLVRQLFELLNR
jgi:hypothetical protein